MTERTKLPVQDWPSRREGDDVNLVDELRRVTRIEEIIGLGENV
jgi:hypothetical protein